MVRQKKKNGMEAIAYRDNILMNLLYSFYEKIEKNISISGILVD